MNRLTDIQEFWNYLKLIYKYPLNMFRKFEKNSSSRTGVFIDNLFLVRKWGNEGTKRHTRNMKFFRIIPRISPDNLRQIAHSELELSLITNFLYGSEVMKRLTDIQKILNYLELVYKHSKNVSRKFEKYSSSTTGYIPIHFLF